MVKDIGLTNPRSTQPSVPPGSVNRVNAFLAKGRRNAFTCVERQVTPCECDPIWQVTSRSSKVCTRRAGISFNLIV